MCKSCVNHLFYADDLVLLAPSPTAVQMLLDICDRYAQTHAIVFNFKNPFVCLFLPKSLKLKTPIFYLSDVPLPWVKEHKYLGVILSDDNYDDVDTRRQTRSLYARGNTTVRKFGNCLDSVKIRLFTTYCICSYGMSLLTHCHVSCIKSLKVAYNNCLRYLFRLGRGVSISAERIKLGIDCFDVVRRKSIFNLWNRLQHSHNSFIRSIVNSL